MAPVNTNGPTLLLFDKIANIWHKMEQGEVNIVVTANDCKRYCKRAKERTASS